MFPTLSRSGPRTELSWLRYVAIGSSASSLPLVTVLLVAAFLRLYGVPYAQYRLDDDQMFTLAIEALRAGVLPLSGMQASVGVDNGPVALYVLMVAVALMGTEVGATAFMALLDVVAVALTYPFVRSFLGRRVALLSTLLFAINQWAVVYASRVWLNAVIPLFTLLFFWTLLAVVRQSHAMEAGPTAPVSGRSIALRSLAFGLAASALMQVHLSGIAHGYTILAAVAVAGLWRRPRPLLPAAGAFAATFAPYLLAVFVPQLQAVMAQQPTEESPNDRLTLTLADPDRLRAFHYLLTSRGYQTYANQAGQIVDTTQGVFLVADGVMIAAFALGVAVAAWRAIHRSGLERSIHVLLLAWVISPVLLPGPSAGVRSFQYVNPFHVLVTFPGALVLVAIGTCEAAGYLGRRRRPMGAVPYGAGAAVVALHLIAAGAYFAVQHEYWPLANYGWPLGHTMAVADMTVRQAGGSPVLLAGHDGGPGILYRVLQRRGQDLRFFDDRNLVLMLPRGQEPFYLTTDDDAWAAQYLLATFPQRQMASYTFPGSGLTFRLFRLRSEELEAGVERWLPGEDLGRFADVAQVESARVVGEVRPGGGFEVFLRWRFLREPPEPYMTRLFLVDESGKRLFFHEEVAYPARRRQQEADYPAPFWRVGDATVLEFFNRFLVPVPPEVPPGTYTVTMRMVSIVDWRDVGKAIPLGQVRVLGPET